MEYTACFLTTCLKDVNVAAQPESIGARSSLLFFAPDTVHESSKYVSIFNPASSSLYSYLCAMRIQNVDSSFEAS